MGDNLSHAWPLADEALSQQILDLVQQAAQQKQLKRGANESIKSLNRGTSEIVILAADVVPPALNASLPLVAENKNVPYIYIPSMTALGRACGVPRPIIAASITTNDKSELADQIRKLKTAVERLMI